MSPLETPASVGKLEKRGRLPDDSRIGGQRVRNGRQSPRDDNGRKGDTAGGSSSASCSARELSPRCSSSSYSAVRDGGPGYSRRNQNTHKEVTNAARNTLSRNTFGNTSDAARGGGRERSAGDMNGRSRYDRPAFRQDESKNGRFNPGSTGGRGGGGGSGGGRSSRSSKSESTSGKRSEASRGSSNSVVPGKTRSSLPAGPRDKSAVRAGTSAREVARGSHGGGGGIGGRKGGRSANEAAKSGSKSGSTPNQNVVCSILKGMCDTWK